MTAIVEGVLRDGDAIRIGPLEVVRSGTILNVMSRRRGRADLIVLGRSFGFTATSRDLPPEFKSAAPSSLRSSVPSPLPLVRTGQGDFARDLNEEDLL